HPIQEHRWWFLLAVLALLGSRGFMSIRVAKPDTAVDMPSVWDHLRSELCGRVYDGWIQGVLQPSLQLLGQTLTIPMLDPRDVVSRTQELTVFSGSLESPIGADVKKIYERSQGQLLILGDPGTGKTTLLLRIARALLDKACRDSQAPVPVVFHAST